MFLHVTNAEAIVLVLVDAPLSTTSISAAHVAQKADGWILPKRNIEVAPFVPIEVLQKAFSTFGQDAVLRFMNTRFDLRDTDSARAAEWLERTSRTDDHAHMFHAMLAVSECQSMVKDVERDFAQVQYQVMESLERKSLTLMRNFRTQLADLRKLFAYTRTQIMISDTARYLQKDRKEKWYKFQRPAVLHALGTTSKATDHSKHEHPSSDSTNAQQRESQTVDGEVLERVQPTLDILTLTDSMSKIEARLDVVARAINDEIQLFIASVSVRDSEIMIEDSKIMREDSRVMREVSEVMIKDSRIMRQQTILTSHLTTLAVIYLPLQLITGIFGMNITEVTGSGNTRWWMCVIALPLVGLFTYTIFEVLGLWRRRRQNLHGQSNSFAVEHHASKRQQPENLQSAALGMRSLACKQRLDCLSTVPM